MRATRLLQILLMLQHRGRMTARALAAELEVAERTVLRDVDALNAAGLPVITHPGHGGGIALGFDYRTRLTGLDGDEAEALAVILAAPVAALADLGLAAAAARARAKLRAGLPDAVARRMALADRRFRVAAAPADGGDPRRAALAQAAREGRVVRLRSDSVEPVVVHPVALIAGPAGWAVECGLTGRQIAEADWGAVHVSAEWFAAGGRRGG